MQKLNHSKKDSKTFWKLLDKLERKQDDTTFKQGISNQKWTAHFKAIFQGTKSNLPLPKNTAERGALDYEITDEEINLGTYILRNGKSPGHDSVSNEMLSCLLKVRPDILKRVFNALLHYPSYIEKWNISMISPIHKSGSKTNADNYRGISLISCFAKFFFSILNQRITKFAIDNKILSNSQLGFLSGCRTSDALLILHNIIDHYCKRSSQHIFGCFVDFQKVFDSVPRNKLFQKLLNHNINGKFYDCLVNIYTEDKACIKIGNTVTETFVTNQGVKQGCILSPILFNIFLSDLQTIFEQTKCEPVQISESIPLSCMIWADDLLLLSKSQIGLQNMLTELNSYCQKNGITLNIKKTKVMIFNKSGRHIRRSIYYGDHRLETTRQYKYLGFMVTPSGEITTGLKDLKDRALRAFFKMKNKLGILFRKCPLISIKLFNALVQPILLYASDFWGILKPPQNNPIENTHLSFCKQLLGVQKQTTNVGVLLELGEVPLSLLARRNAIKNWTRIANKTKCNDLVIKSYENATQNSLSWPSKIEGLISEMGMRDLFLKRDQDIHIKTFQRMKDNFHQEAFAKIRNESSKLFTYSRLKKSIGCEEYLTKIENIQERTSFSKLRLSNHSLMIEKGRHEKIERSSRYCPFCPNTVEDEIHFIVTCKSFIKVRIETWEKISQKIPSFQHLTDTQKFVLLMSDNSFISVIAQYICRALEIRNFLIDKHKNNQ